MINVCPQCGIYRDDKIVDCSGQSVTCPVCGHAHPFICRPLLILDGASGSGKSTICLRLASELDEVVVLDADILWGPEYSAPDQWPRFFNLWLRLCKNIGQAGKPVLLCGAGVGVPANLDACVERRYFSHIHRLALICDDDLLVRRLLARPAWRNSADPAGLEEQVQFNRWFREQAGQADPPLAVLDTTGATVEESAAAVARWIRQRM